MTHCTRSVYLTVAESWLCSEVRAWSWKVLCLPLRLRGCVNDCACSETSLWTHKTFLINGTAVSYCSSAGRGIRRSTANRQVPEPCCGEELG